jgi:hypothetical protein
VPIPEAGGVVLFGWCGDGAPQGVHGADGGAGYCVVAVMLLCGCARPVGVGHCGMAGCGLSVGVVGVSGEVVGGVDGMPHGSPFLFFAPLFGSCPSHKQELDPKEQLLYKWLVNFFEANESAFVFDAP